ncbi:MAG: ABC transporter permease [Dehalococcoidia bacterium]
MKRHTRRGALLLLLALAPFAVVAVQSVANRWTGPALVPQDVGLRGWRAVLDDPQLWRAVINSAGVAVVATLVALPIGWGAARAAAAVTGRMRLAVLGAVLLPLVVPPLAVGTGLATWLLRLGLADSIAGVTIAHLLYVLPYVVLGLLPGFDRSLSDGEEAAEVLGAGSMLRFRTVTLPAMRASVALAAALGFIVSWSQYGTSLAVGGGIPLLPLVVVPFLRADAQIGAALTIVLLLPAAAVAAAAAASNRSPRPTVEVP